MTSWSSSIKKKILQALECIIKIICHGVKQMQKHVPLMKQNVMQLEVFILGGQRIDQKRMKRWWRERKVSIEKWSRERIVLEGKRELS